MFTRKSGTLKGFKTPIIIGLALVVMATTLIDVCLGHSSPRGTVIEYQQGKLSVDLHKVSIKKALEEVAKKATVSIVFDPPSKETRAVTVSFKNLPLDEGLKRIIAPNSWVMVFGGVPLVLMGVKVLPSASVNLTQIKSLNVKQPKQSIDSQNKAVWTEENIRNEKIWSSQPMLSSLLYEDSIAEDLKTKVGLSDEHLLEMKRLAEIVMESYRSLDTEANSVIHDMNLTDTEKQNKINDIGYNQRVLQIVNTAHENMRALLPIDAYERYVDWVEQRYKEVERIGEEYRQKPPPDSSQARTFTLPSYK